MFSKLFDARVRSFVLLAPSRRAVRGDFRHVDTSPGQYHELLADMQRLRGRVYLEDGAIERDQLIDSRHELDIDADSWHLLIVDSRRRVRGCARYCEYTKTTGFHRLTVARSALAGCRTHGHRLRRSVEAEMERAGRLNLPFVELGGWALDQSVRASMDAFRMAMATYALAQALGGGVGISTATQRHSSSSILRRLGGAGLEHEGTELPPYYDPEYRCGMEVLRFYSWAPNLRYASRVEELSAVLRATPVFCGGRPHHSPQLPRTFSRPFAPLALAAS